MSSILNLFDTMLHFAKVKSDFFTWIHTLDTIAEDFLSVSLELFVYICAKS